MNQNDNEKILREVKIHLYSSKSNKKVANNKSANSNTLVEKNIKKTNEELSVNQLISREVRLWIKNNGPKVTTNIIEKVLKEILK